MKNIIVSIVVSFLIFTACQQQYQLTDSQKTEIIKEVETMATQFFIDYNNKNIDAVVRSLDDSPKFFWVFPPETTHLSRDKLVSSLTLEIESALFLEAAWDEIIVEPLASDFAYCKGVFNVVITDSLKNEKKFIGIESAVVVKRKDGWKFLMGQTSTSKI